MRLAAIVLNYRAPTATRRAVRSLLASRRRIDEVLVVDNDCREPCRAALGPLISSVTYIQNPRNRGFSGGVNVGDDGADDDNGDGDAPEDDDEE